MRFNKGAIKIFGSDESGNKNFWDLKYAFGGIEIGAKNGDLIVKEKNNDVESDYDDLKKKTKYDGAKSTKNILVRRAHTRVRRAQNTRVRRAQNTMVVT